MNTWVEPPPPQKGMGCFAKGCLILVIFAGLLVIGCIAGIYWGARNYSVVIHGFSWLNKTNAVSATPAPIPEFSATRAEIETVQNRWQKFEETAHQGQAAEIELTATDLNALIAANPDLEGKVFASIEGNRLRLQTSFPMHGAFRQSGYYLNFDIVIETDGAEALDHPQLNRITVNGRPLPSDLLEWTLKARRIRDYFEEFTKTYGTGSVEVRDGKLILRSSGSLP